MLKGVKNKIADKARSSPFLQSRGQWSLYRFFIFIFSYRGQKRIWNFAGKVIRFFIRKVLGISDPGKDLYAEWRKKNIPSAKSLEQFIKQSNAFNHQPLISIIVPVKQADEVHLNETLTGSINQIYRNLELIVSCDRSIKPELKTFIDSFNSSDSRIKVLYNGCGNRSVSLVNQAQRVAEGAFVIVVEPGDMLSVDALYQFVDICNKYPSVCMSYTDHDHIDGSGKLSNPHFKPDWCPDSILSRNYIQQPAFLHNSVVGRLGGFDEQFENDYLYDMILKFSEESDQLYHIPKVLYHKRIQMPPLHPGKSDQSAVLEAALRRRNIQGSVIRHDSIENIYTIRYKILNPEKVSVIIPTRNKHTLCDVAISSILKLTDYPNYEIILVDNNSDEAPFFDMVQTYREKEPLRFKYIKDEGGFNFSRIMNLGASHATGEYLILLNNDTEVIHPDWMSAMIEYCQFSKAGVVGVKLLYPNDTVQHAGVIVGLGGIANHPFVGSNTSDPGYFGQLQAVTNYSALTAACFMVRSSVYQEVNGFDESLAVEFNDVDFCLRVCSKGYHNVWLPHVKLYHYESISRGHPHKTRKAYRQHLADMAFFRNKWQNFIDHDPCYSPNLTRIFTDYRIRVQEL